MSVWRCDSKRLLGAGQKEMSTKGQHFHFRVSGFLDLLMIVDHKSRIIKLCLCSKNKTHRHAICHKTYSKYLQLKSKFKAYFWVFFLCFLSNGFINSFCIKYLKLLSFFLSYNSLPNELLLFYLNYLFILWLHYDFFIKWLELLLHSYFFLFSASCLMMFLS